MKKDDFKMALLTAASGGTLLTPKHDPTSIGQALSGYRTVTVTNPSGLTDFLNAGRYRVRQYENTGGKHAGPYFEIIPDDPALVPGSKIPSRSPIPTHACDRFVAVSGSKQAWHVFAEESAKVQDKVQKGELRLVGEL